MKKNGIQFRSINKNKSPMRIIMKNIDTSVYKYHISDLEVLNYVGDIHECDNLWHLIGDINDENIDYVNLLKKGNSYYPIFFGACLFLKTPKNISKASDYFDNDDLKIAFFQWDTEYYSVFAKDEEIVQQIYENIKDHEDFTEIEFVENQRYWGHE